MQSEENVQVVHSELDNAVHVLPDQVSALGETRTLLTSRTVPASAFGDVDSSAQVGETHAGNVARTHKGLGYSSDWLDEIIGRIRGTGDSVKEYDTAQATQQQTQNQSLMRLDPTKPTVRLPNGRTFQVNRGEKHLVPEDSIIEEPGGRSFGRETPAYHFESSDGTDIRKVPQEKLPQN